MPRNTLFATALFLAVPALTLAGPANAAQDDHHPELAGSVKAFHDVLRVDWHADKGDARNAAACRNVGHYIALSRDIADQAAPAAADEAAWKSATTGLGDASVALGAYCGGGVAANVEAGLATLHDRFHDLMAAMNGAVEASGE